MLNNVYICELSTGAEGIDMNTGNEIIMSIIMFIIPIVLIIGFIVLIILFSLLMRDLFRGH